jgi:hypothetical protein
MYEVVWSWYQPQPWSCGIIFTTQGILTSQIRGQLGQCNGIRMHTYSLEKSYQWLKHLLCLIWMYEAIWGGYQPQPWGYGIISTPQVTLTSQIWANLAGVTVLGCNHMPLRQHTKCSNPLYLSNEDVGSSLRWISASDLEFPNLSQLGRCTDIRVHPYALETAYQWPKHFLYV